MTKYNGDPPHIVRAKGLLTEALQRRTVAAATEYQKPAGVISILDILAAEASLSAAQREFDEYQRGDQHMHETLDATGRKGLAVDNLRAEFLEEKRAKIEKRRTELATITRRWIAGSEK